MEQLNRHHDFNHLLNTKQNSDINMLEFMNQNNLNELLSTAAVNYNKTYKNWNKKHSCLHVLQITDDCKTKTTHKQINLIDFIYVNHVI